VKLGNNESDTCTVLSKAYEGETIKKSNAFEWHKWFKEGHKNMDDDDERSGCPRLTEPIKMLKKCRSWGI
jgi:hypothetical protein